MVSRSQFGDAAVEEHSGVVVGEAAERPICAAPKETILLQERSM